MNTVLGSILRFEQNNQFARNMTQSHRAETIGWQGERFEDSAYDLNDQITRLIGRTAPADLRWRVLSHGQPEGDVDVDLHVGQVLVGAELIFLEGILHSRIDGTEAPPHPYWLERAFGDVDMTIKDIEVVGSGKGSIPKPLSITYSDGQMTDFQWSDLDDFVQRMIAGADLLKPRTIEPAGASL